MEVLQNSQKFRVLWHGRTEKHKFRAGIKMLYRYPGYLWHGRTELTEVPGTCMNVVQNFYRSSGHGDECPTDIQKFFVG